MPSWKSATGFECPGECNRLWRSVVQCSTVCIEILLRNQRRGPGRGLHDFFQTNFVSYFWHRLGMHFFQFLVATWVQLAPPAWRQIHPKSCQEGSKSRAHLHHGFDAILIDLEASWVEFWIAVGLNLRAKLASWPKSIKKNISFKL